MDADVAGPGADKGETVDGDQELFERIRSRLEQDADVLRWTDRKTRQRLLHRVAKLAAEEAKADPQAVTWESARTRPLSTAELDDPRDVLIGRLARILDVADGGHHAASYAALVSSARQLRGNDRFAVVDNHAEISSDLGGNKDLLLEARDLCSFADLKFANFVDRVGDDLCPESSPAWRTQQRLNRQFGPIGNWPSDLVERMTVRGCIYLLICGQHIATLRLMLGNGARGLSFGPVARSVVEASGMVAWLLDPELDLGAVRARAARLLLDEAGDVTRFKTMAVKLGHEAAPRLGDEYRLARDLVAKNQLFYASERERKKSGEMVVRGQELPGPSEAVLKAEESLNKGRDVAGVTYGYLSSMTHPSVRAYVETLERPAQAGERLRLSPRSDPIFFAKLTVHAVSAFTDAWRLYASWIGAGTEEADEVVARANELQVDVGQRQEEKEKCKKSSN